MLSFIVQRLFQSIIVMISVAFVSFALFQFVGDPINNMVGQDATEEQRQLLREKLGLDKPWPLQFANFVLRRMYLKGLHVFWRSPVEFTGFPVLIFAFARRLSAFCPSKAFELKDRPVIGKSF